MKIRDLKTIWLISSICSTCYAIDDFHVQMSKVMHEDTSLDHDIYTKAGSSGLWTSESPWLQKPAISARFTATHQERGGPFRAALEDDLYSPMVDLHLQTWGGVNVGVTYAHGFLSEENIFGFRKFEFEADMDSVGGYVAKQCDCGFKVGATWAYSTADFRAKHSNRRIYEFEATGGSGNVGFARSVGDKTSWKNVFVDTSANFLYQSEEEAWYFVWMAKVGHNLCERFAVYGVFNLFYEMDYGARFEIPTGFAGYRPYADDTWGEAGGGIQAQIFNGLSFTAEATTPVLDENFVAIDAFQVRGGLNWRF